MARISSSLEAETGVTVVVVEATVDAEQVLNQCISFLTGEPTPLVLWDFMQGNLAALSSADLRMIVERGAPYASNRKGGRTALVCARELDFGLCRMFQAFASLQDIPFAIEVFRSPEAARTWLSGTA